MKMHVASSATIVVLLAGVAVTGCGIDHELNATSARTAPAAESSAQAPSELRDYRYCEVIPSVTEGDTTTTYVWNTTGSNLCPPELWNSITEAEVNQEFGSQSAQLNGPRHWVMDSISATGESTTGQTFTFGGIEFNLRAILTTPAGQPTVGQQFYVPNQVQRDTTYTYTAGRPIFELTDPDGNVYVMQSYAQIVDKTLTYEQLPSLANKLNLPEGWTYSTETPEQDFELVATGLAYVINDDLGNSYQRQLQGGHCAVVVELRSGLRDAGCDARPPRVVADRDMCVRERESYSSVQGRVITSRLEDEAITIIREVAAECERPVLLFSGGKDSVVVLHLAWRAFSPARIPFPVMHVDTGHNFDEVIEFRDRTVAAFGVELVVASVQASIDEGQRPRSARAAVVAQPAADRHVAGRHRPPPLRCRLRRRQARRGTIAGQGACGVAS